MNTVARVKTRIWVFQVELRSDFDEIAVDFKHEEAVVLSTALPDLEFAGSQVVKISHFKPAAIFSKRKQNDLYHLITLNKVNIVFLNCNSCSAEKS